MPTSRRFIAWTTVLVFALAALYAAVVWISSDILHGDEDSGPQAITSLPAVTISGKQTTVLDWSRDACSSNDYADLPVRAYRDAQGQVQMVTSHVVNRRMSGSSLGDLRHSCDVVFRSDENPDPARFDDREWIAAPYTPDGRNVYALLHEEYQGHRHGGRCPSGVYFNCWYNAITFATSRDGGRTFQQPEPPRQLVAASPYRYKAEAGPYGLFAPSNIVRNPRDGYYYALVRAEKHRAQRRGSCLIRTRDLSNPQEWRGWNGFSFGVRFVDPYRFKITKANEHVCDPVSPTEIQSMSSSLTWSTHFNKWLLIGAASESSPTGRTAWGVFYSLSDDLIHWQRRKLIREVEFVYTYKCGDQNPIMYPSLLDPKSTSRNFATVGKNSWLYFTRSHYKSCKLTSNRDLVRVPVTFTSKP